MNRIRISPRRQAIATLATLTAITLTACGSDDPTEVAPTDDPTTSDATPAPDPEPSPTTETDGAGPIGLPAGFQPEGIAADDGTAYLGSLADGRIYELDLATGEGSVLVEGDGTPSVGLALEDDLLFVAGGADGDAMVVDTESGRVVASYDLTEGEAFVNDVIVTDEAAYFTNSMSAEFYAVPLGDDGALPEPEEIQTVSLGGEWEQGDGFGANGIETTPDEEALLIINSTSGILYRVDPTSGEATTVDLGGADLATGDGMLRDDETLYVVRNRMNQVAVVTLDESAATGEVGDSISSPDFDVPTTVAESDDTLYLPNARFGTDPTPDTEYDVVSVPSAG